MTTSQRPPLSPWDAPGLPETAKQSGDGTVECLGLAVRRKSTGDPVSHYFHGDDVCIDGFFQIRETFEVAWMWVELRDADGRLIHASDGFTDVAVVRENAPDEVVHFQAELTLAISPGVYSLAVGVSTVDAGSYTAFFLDSAGIDSAYISQDDFDSTIVERIRVESAARIVIGRNRYGRLPHRGLVDLPRTAARKPSPPALDDASVDAPMIVHVTHQKAGSQWIRAILEAAAPGRTVSPGYQVGHFRFRAPKPGLIYPGLMMDRMRYELVFGHLETRRFVVIRDIRDALVSAYFSWAKSHRIVGVTEATRRVLLSDTEEEQGLLHLVETWAPEVAHIQLSWVEAGEPFIRYEDLLHDDVAILRSVLIEHCGLNISPEHLERIVVANRFDEMRRARPDDQHQRVGKAGDWRNHFTDRVTEAVKARYGGLLVATGHETDLAW